MKRIISRLGGCSIRARLMLACCAMALVTGVVGGFAVWALSRVNDAFQVLATRNGQRSIISCRLTAICSRSWWRSEVSCS